MNTALISKLMRFVRPYIQYLLLALLCSFIGVGASLVIPIATGSAIDLIIGAGNVDFAGIVRILRLLTVLIIISAAMQWISGTLSGIMTYKTARDIRCAVFYKLGRLPLSKLDSTKQGEIISRIANDTEFIADGLLQGFNQLFNGIVMIIGTICFMVSINVKIAVTVILVTPLSLFVAWFIARGCHKMFKKQSEIRGQLTAYSEEIITNVDLVKTFCYEQKAIDGFEKINGELNRCGVRAQFYSALTNPCTRFVNSIVFALTGVIGGIFAVNGLMRVGQIASFLAYANQYTKPFNEISGVIAELQSSFASARRVFGLYEETEQPDDFALPKLTCGNGAVEFKNVCFSYTPEKKLIENFNLKVKSGQKIAIVGKTGCGKTTLINLLLRFFETNSGEITVGGSNIKEITRNSLRSSFGMVLQETWLFSGTIRENIAYGKPEASDDEIISAAKAAYIHSFIKRLPKGYDTVIGEGGYEMSTGQRQLISIARVMLKKPPMLILDEATSNIDTMTEVRIQRAFEKIMEGRTSFIVAHRLSTVKNADVILFMKDGNVAEQGSHDELMARHGGYFEMYNSL